MATPTLATFAGIAMAGDGSSQYKINSITGWDDLPDARFDSNARSNAHGEFDGPVWSAARTVTIAGECRNAPTRDALLAALGGAFVFAGANAGSTLSVTLAGQTLTSVAKVIAASKARVSGEWGIGRFGWQVQFRCSDPLRYAGAVTDTATMPTTSGGLVFPLFMVSGILTWGTVAVPQVVDLTNTGTADTSVLLSVSAGGTALVGGFSIIETITQSVLTYVDDLQAGNTVTFDSSTGAVTLNGTADRRGSLTVAQWWQVPAGTYRGAILIPLTTFDATAVLTGTIFPAYW